MIHFPHPHNPSPRRALAPFRRPDVRAGRGSYTYPASANAPGAPPVPVVRCPNCRAELDLDPEDVGHKVECPGCLQAFTAVRPTSPPPPPPVESTHASDTPAGTPSDVPPPLPDAAVSPPPPPAPPPPAPPPRATVRSSRRPPDAPITLECPACMGKVSVLADDLGHKVECPMCRQTFRAEDRDRPGGRGSSRYDDEPPRRSSRRSRYDDDWDDRPRRRRGSGYYGDSRDDDPYSSDDPRAWVWRAKRDLASPGGALEVLGYLDVVFGVLSILIGVGFALMVANSTGTGGPGWEIVWYNAGPGLSGVVLGAVKAIGGRSMKQVRHRSLAIFACIAGCAPLNVGCCLIVLMFPAYVVSIVFSIIGMTHLFKKGVRKAFEANRPDGDADAV
jgi:hypothetical protein